MRTGTVEMAASAQVNRSDLFVRYEAALAGLVKVPGALEGELSAAKKSSEAARSSAASSAGSEEERLEKFRGTMAARYGEAAKTLQAANVLLPRQVRPAAGQKGDANSIANAINAQQEAEKAVAIELQAASNTVKQQAVDNKARAKAGREAAEALRRRQEQVRKARQETEAEAERKRLVEEERARRSRQVIIRGGVALVVLLVVVVALLLT